MILNAFTWPLAFISTQLAKLAADCAGKPREPEASALSLAALDQLREWIDLGAGEQGGNNRGDWIESWAKRRTANWCAAVLVAAHEEGAARLGVAMPFERTLGAKRLVTNVGNAGSFIDTKADPASVELLPGDFISYHRGARDSWKGHVRLVERYDRHSRLIHYIAGNEGRFPAPLRRGTILLNARDQVAVARLLSLRRSNHAPPAL